MAVVPRTLLFVPADRPDRIAKAVASGADAVAVDLEDALSEARKQVGRSLAAAALGDVTDAAVSLVVRVNAIGTPHVAADIAGLTPVLDRLTAVLLPKAESRDDVQELSALLERAETASGVAVGRTRILATTETAAGVLAAREIASASERVLTLLFGPADLSSELGLEPTAAGAELATARSTVVLAAAAARVAQPIDGPHLVLHDDDGLETSALTARRLGFGGKACLHPAQLPIVARVFAPSDEEIAWARQVDQVFSEAERQGHAAVRLPDGTFVDPPVAQRARSLLRAQTAEARRG